MKHCHNFVPRVQARQRSCISRQQWSKRARARMDETNPGATNLCIGSMQACIDMQPRTSSRPGTTCWCQSVVQGSFGGRQMQVPIAAYRPSQFTNDQMAKSVSTFRHNGTVLATAPALQYVMCKCGRALSLAADPLMQSQGFRIRHGDEPMGSYPESWSSFWAFWRLNRTPQSDNICRRRSTEY